MGISTHETTAPAPRFEQIRQVPDSPIGVSAYYAREQGLNRPVLLVSPSARVLADWALCAQFLQFMHTIAEKGGPRRVWDLSSGNWLILDVEFEKPTKAKEETVYDLSNC